MHIRVCACASVEAVFLCFRENAVFFSLCFMTGIFYGVLLPRSQKRLVQKATSAFKGALQLLINRYG